MDLNSCRPFHRPTPCVNLRRCHLALVLRPRTQCCREPIWVKTSTWTCSPYSILWPSCIYFARRRHHAKEHKGEDHIRGHPGRHTVHVHGRGDGSLGCLKPSGEHGEQYLRGGPFWLVEALQEEHLYGGSRECRERMWTTESARR